MPWIKEHRKHCILVHDASGHYIECRLQLSRDRKLALKELKMFEVDLARAISKVEQLMKLNPPENGTANSIEVTPEEV